MKTEKKNQNEIARFYQNLSRREKGKFLLWVQLKTERSQGTVIARIKDDGWRRIERDIITEGMENDTWRNI